jgi:hypothetical protein
MSARPPSHHQAIKGGHLSRWIAFFLDYFDAEARLVAADSRETRSHFFGLLFLIATALLLYLTSVLM